MFNNVLNIIASYEKHSFFGKEALGNIPILLLRIVTSKFLLSSWTAPTWLTDFARRKVYHVFLKILEILHSNKLASNY